MTVGGTCERACTMDFQAGHVGYIEKTLPHYIQNIGDDDLRFLELFRSSRFEDVSFSE
jgi:oxalate decarboxylase